MAVMHTPQELPGVWQSGYTRATRPCELWFAHQTPCPLPDNTEPQPCVRPCGLAVMPLGVGTSVVALGLGTAAFPHAV